MGSVAYGASSDTSDMDVYGFCIPPKKMVFPHLDGEIMGFGTQKKRFEQWSEHHVHDASAKSGHGKTYDFAVYGIVKYFNLVMQNNPNMLDSLFVPANCVLYQTQIGQLIRENRKLFVHKGSFQKFKGYAYSQLNKMENKKGEGKRSPLIEKYGFDVKFGYHLVRLLLEAEEILETGNLTLNRNGALLKSIRNGGWTKEQVIDFFHTKEAALEKLYNESDLQHAPDEDAIKALLVRCLEMHYGSLDKTIHFKDNDAKTIDEIVKTLQVGGYI